ncbi:Chlorocatechol 1,2-dioxygenase [Corynebacterium fournieri]|nr:Chlorocatechol 1,2-dioxygenase [Corynebacterium fournieri]
MGTRDNNTVNGANEAPKSFEGRVLPNQAEDPEDQGLIFDMATIENRLSRRKLLGIFGLGVGTAALAACAPSTSSTTSASSAAPSSRTEQLTEMNTETAGPYPGDGSNGPDVLEKVGVERSDIRGSIGGGSTASGVPLKLKMNIVDMVENNSPMVGAAVYIWHCDAAGRYSMYSSGLENETYLRGVQVTGDDGSVEFTTIIPGCYEGRWPHIHFEVFPSVDVRRGVPNRQLHRLRDAVWPNHARYRQHLQRRLGAADP